MNDEILELTDSDEDELERFREFLSWAKRVVDSWPEWKKNTLGWWRSDGDAETNEVNE